MQKIGYLVITARASDKLPGMTPTGRISKKLKIAFGEEICKQIMVKGKKRAAGPSK